MPARVLATEQESGLATWVDSSAIPGLGRVRATAATGQSNSMGAYHTDADGSVAPLRGTEAVRVLNADLATWGGSDYDAPPWTDSAPNGNLGQANIGLSFACRLQAELGGIVYHSHYARSGQSIEEWVDPADSPMWDGFKAKVDAMFATAELVAAGVTTLDALVWTQGESDSDLVYGPGDTFPLVETVDQVNNDEIYRTYLSNLELLLTRLRTETTWFGPNSLLIITGPSRLHERYSPILAMVDFAERWPQVVFASTRGMTTREDLGDSSHFDGTSLDTIGYKLAWWAYQNGFMPGRLGSQILFTDRQGQPYAREGTSVTDTMIGPEGAAFDMALKAVRTPRKSTVTIAAGAITITNGYHSVDTEGAAATDDLTTINGGVDGMRLVLRQATSGRDINYVHGVGNLALANNADFLTVDTRSLIEFIYDATLGDWIEISRSP